jgi:5-methylcytosine-specific restriction endonuclease McrA
MTSIIWGLDIPVPGSRFKEWDRITDKPVIEACFRHKDFSFELCDRCGEQVTGDRRSAGLTTCSTACTARLWDIRHDFAITKEREQRGKRPSRFWEVIKQECFRRDRYTCQGCGKTRSTLDVLRNHYLATGGDIDGTGKPSDFLLNVHHIRPVAEGGDNTPDNLVTLCGKCHKKAHSTVANKRRRHIGLESFGILPVGQKG